MAAFSPTQRPRFEDQGYLKVPGALDPDAPMAPILEDDAGVLDGFATSHHVNTAPGTG